MKEAVIVAGARTPVGKAKKGSLKNSRPDDLAALTIKETLKRAGNYEGTIDDVIIGCAMPEAEQGMNMARNIAGLAGLKQDVPGITINRYCSSGLQSIAFAAERIMVGSSDTIIAGGAESMSLIPMGGHVIKPNSKLVQDAPGYYMGMGHTAEEVANRFGISRTDQDMFAAQSHERAAKAIQEGKFTEEIVPVEITERVIGKNNKVEEKKFTFEMDEGVRVGTTTEVLAKLRPAFHVKGSVTAGNSSQMSDGAASVLVMDKEKALAEGLVPLVKFRSFAVAGVEPEIMGVGPVEAIPKALKIAGLQLADIGLFELNEAFASQSLRVIEALDLDIAKVNVNGGAIALGHPLGMTGTKLTLSLINEMKRQQVQFGVVTMCIGGGMGAAGVFELV
ncbi:acetyl-CoA C-acetyltransferase [Virgibacillus halodenitrificans]|uniref:acetyl-CoA C-acyltransferase n=1 Tax=Virgibacillus halodenitrificans TaxID=1482 RepID=A0ABR7VN85_VIRHA|nr:acetyl-CoA C-acetyltransferase [Virgibacillus halodenitrificans]MBD1223365.1 acetyl-CoA C-acetyltransferase [Virgibacillus halodenitrificans]MCG1026943.1 acetyl-CoA C-acetyltransferase [Virgibacillus halodenitrificans]MEC2158991.1 acetyl-CoA C-acetyltransferase [Virgibacillus halodenitrificans]MYL46024.1 acetyl-CoA C-acetyltransferase [Virgibacillus halodenitrificans]CDQ30736.1 3-ketoacyl-CoA thiolase [Virgibacillus halodenitrificans]